MKGHIPAKLLAHALREPPRLLWLRTLELTDEWSRFHTAGTNELIHVVEGSAKIDCGRRAFGVKAGDTFVIPKGTRHRDVRGKGSPYRVTYVFFEWRSGQAMLRRLIGAGSAAAPANVRTRLRWLIQELDQAVSSGTPAAVATTQMALLEILLCLVRHTKGAASESADVGKTLAAQRRHDLARSVERYVVAHCHEPIRLNMLARLHRVSASHLCRTVSRELGMPMHEVWNLARADRAKQMLSDGKLSVKEVSRALGFAYPNYFSRLFRRVTGLSPTAYQLATSAAAQAGRRQSAAGNRMSH